VSWERPLPAPDPVSQRFWAAAAEGELLVQQCPACGHRQFYPRALCTRCAAEPEWLRASGRGTVHTFTVVRQNGARPFRDELPYVVAMVELDEGVRMMGNVVDCDPGDVHIGMEVEVTFVPADEGIGVPFWRPAAPRSGPRPGRARDRAGDSSENRVVGAEEGEGAARGGGGGGSG
jgi:uncharacterized OB-fold protein